MMAVNLEAPRSSKRPPAEVLGLRDAENHERGRLESRAPASRYPKLVLATKTFDSVTPKLEGVRRHNTMVTRWCYMRQPEAESVPAGPASASGTYPNAQGNDVMSDLRTALSSDDRAYPPGPLARVKRGATSDPGYPQPQAAEVESARLLANDARQTLRTADFSDGDIDRLADDFIAEDRGEDTEAFIDWAHRIRRAAPSGTRSVDPG
jgi:hypothetical protein